MAAISAETKPVPSAESRLDWVDVAKGLAIFLVVFGHVVGGLVTSGILPGSWEPHNPTWATFIYDWTYTFHMPAFLLLSGLFFERSLRRGPAGFLVERLKTLYYPFWLWSLIYLGLAYALVGVVNTRPKDGALVLLLLDPREGLWFLVTLMWLSAIYAALRTLRVSAGLMLGAGVIATALVLMLGSAEQAVLQGPLGIVRHLAWAWTWVLLGVVSAQVWGERVARWPTRLLVLVGLVAACGSIVLAATMPARPAWDIPPRPLVAPAGVVMLLVIAMVLARTPLSGMLAWWGRRSLEIYVLSSLAMVGTRMALWRFAHIDDGAVHLVLGTLMGMGVPLAAVWVCDAAGVRFLFRWPSTRVPRPGGASASAEIPSVPTGTDGKSGG